MKKIILAILTACLLFSLCACQKTDNINIEDFSAKHSVMYKESKYVSYYCDFENGILTVDRNTYKDNPASPSGVILVDTETTTYHYTLKQAIYSYDINNDNSISEYEMELFLKAHPKVMNDKQFMDM